MKQKMYTDGSPSRELEDNDYDQLTGASGITCCGERITAIRIRDKITQLKSLVLTIALSQYCDAREVLADYVIPHLDQIEEDLRTL